MSRIVTAARVATLVGTLGSDERPLYVELAEQLRLLIGEGRIPAATRLPSERDLTAALGVSRTTVTRAYAELRERDYAESRRGSGTVTRLPLRAESVTDRVFAPWSQDPDVIDLNCAAPSAPAGVAAAYDAAVGELPAYLSSHGYYPAGLPRLQAAVAATYDERGLPTAPEQVIITAGALGAAAIVAQALTAPGDRVVVEDPVYPNATQALSHRSARLVPAPVDPGGWDVPATAAIIRQAAPRLAYLVPDFQNPTGQPDVRRPARGVRRRAASRPRGPGRRRGPPGPGPRRPGDAARRSRRTCPGTVTIGSASKQFWGGLRLGWLRVPETMVPQLLHARMSLDLGAPAGRAARAAAPARAPARGVGGQPRAAADPARGAARRPGRPAAGVGVRAARRRARGVVPAAAAAGVGRWSRRPSDAAWSSPRAGSSPWRAGSSTTCGSPGPGPTEELETAVGRLRDAWDVVAHGRGGDGGAADRLTVA